MSIKLLSWPVMALSVLLLSACGGPRERVTVVDTLTAVGPEAEQALRETLYGEPDTALVVYEKGRCKYALKFPGGHYNGRHYAYGYYCVRRVERTYSPVSVSYVGANYAGYGPWPGPARYRYPDPPRVVVYSTGIPHGGHRHR